MDLNRIARQKNQRLYYPIYFRRILSVMWLTLLINIALVPILIFFYFSQDQTLYYANDFNGHVTPISPILNYVHEAPPVVVAAPTNNTTQP